MSSLAYDILRKDDLGEPVWVDAVESLERAKKRIIELSARRPGQYVVFCQRTGQIVSTMTTVASPAARGEHRNHDGSFEGVHSSSSRSDTLF